MTTEATSLAIPGELARLAQPGEPTPPGFVRAQYPNGRTLVSLFVRPELHAACNGSGETTIAALSGRLYPAQCKCVVERGIAFLRTLAGAVAPAAPAIKSGNALEEAFQEVTKQVKALEEARDGAIVGIAAEQEKLRTEVEATRRRVSKLEETLRSREAEIGRLREACEAEVREIALEANRQTREAEGLLAAQLQALDGEIKTARAAVAELAASERRLTLDLERLASRHAEVVSRYEKQLRNPRTRLERLTKKLRSRQPQGTAAPSKAPPDVAAAGRQNPLIADAIGIEAATLGGQSPSRVPLVNSPSTASELVIEPQEGRKGRSFRAFLLASVEAGALWDGGATATGDVERPVWCVLASSEEELRPFVANLRMGRRALRPKEGYSRNRQSGIELLRSAGYRFTWQREAEGSIVTAYLPELFLLDPGMVDPSGVRFVMLPPAAWAQSQGIDAAPIVRHALRCGVPLKAAELTALVPASYLFGAALIRAPVRALLGHPTPTARGCWVVRPMGRLTGRARPRIVVGAG